LQLLQQKAVDKQIEATQFTQSNLEAAWKTYHPQVDTYIASSTTQDDANKARSLATSDPSQFKSQANDKNLEVKFDSSNTAIPAAVQKAAFALNNNEVSDVIPVQSSSNNTTTYYVIFMINNPGKGNDMSKYTSQLKNYIKTQKENDQTFVAGVIKNYLTKYNVTVKESAFSGIFSNFTGIAPVTPASN
jgi:foldase protein PrsA